MAAPAAVSAEVQQLFCAADADADGYIDAPQLQQLLARQHTPRLGFSLASVARLLRVHDSDLDGRMSLSEFSRLHGFLSNMASSFKYFDRDGSGKLTRGEVHAALVHSGFELDTPAFDALFKAFDPDHDGGLGLPEYVALASFLRSASATFAAFDPHGTGHIKLDFNMFLYAASSCL